MTIKPILKLASAAVLMGVLGTANAATLSFAPDATDAQVGDVVSLDVILDLEGATTIGGGFSIQFDSSALGFVSWTANPLGDPSFAFDTILPGETNGGSCPVNPNVVCGISAGEFNSGLSGMLNFGTIEFNVLELGSIVTGIASSATGPFVDFSTFNEIPVTYVGATVGSAVIPVPAAAWLMFGGLGALFGFGRKRA